MFTLYIMCGCYNFRANWLSPIQSCSYTSRRSAEEKLGIEKPKRPLTPFFKFMSQMRPALLAKNPGITSKEAIAWSSKHWQELDAGVIYYFMLRINCTNVVVIGIMFMKHSIVMCLVLYCNLYICVCVFLIPISMSTWVNVENYLCYIISSLGVCDIIIVPDFHNIVP